MKPRVGIGILNYNGAGLTIKCLDHLGKLDWPAGRLDIVVVDNGSKDDSVLRIKLTHPEVRLITSPVNRGFAGGCNMAIKALADVDYVALLNNDAMVDPGWLAPLVDELEANPEAGAACSKILFATTYVDLVLESEAFNPVGTDTRHLGVRVSGLKVGDESRIDKSHFVTGFWGPEPGGGKEPNYRWTNGNATLRVPFSRDDRGAVVRIRSSAETDKPLTVRTGDQEQVIEVHSMPAWYNLPIEAEPFDLINNVGSDLVEGKNSADRGIFQPDTGQYEEPENVFAWCGCSVLLRPAYLQDVGLFDESFFLYYEDFDLSWRGQRRGWSYSYVPTSIVRHFHASTTGEHSDLFNFYVWRNRLLVLVKNAPTAIAVKEAFSYLDHVYVHVRGDLRQRTLSKPSLTLLKVLGSFALHAPAAAAARVRIGLRNRKQPLQLRSARA